MSAAPSPCMPSRRDVVVVSHTHWDREWYRTFQAFRLRLLDVMDELIDTMQVRPDVAHFVLDGQTIAAEDYIALRPERAAALESLVQSGRLALGPWYVQPDEFLASGEALIRNLMLGHRIAARLGGVSKVGWLPDSFGHAAQLPQILRNFGIEVFVFSRGLGDHLAEPRLEFWWEAPGGHRVLALHQFPGYWSAGNLGYPFFWGDTAGIAPDVDLAAAQVQKLLDRVESQAASRTVALWNGADHMPLQTTLPDLLPVVGERLGCRVRQGSVSDYARAVLEAGTSLPTVRGELRGSRYQALLPSTLSSRIYLKQANHRVERALERRAEPAAAAAWLCGAPYPDAPLREAWRLLLQNHAHDSICGCGLDDVHREMILRFDQAEQIARETSGRALRALAGQMRCGPGAGAGVPVLVFNPLGRQRLEVVEVTLRMASCPPSLVAVGPAGAGSAVQVLSRQTESYAWLDLRTTAEELRSTLRWWRECITILDGLDVAGYDWSAAGEGVALRLGLADRAAARAEVLACLAAEAAELPPGTPVRMTAGYECVRLAFTAHVPACGAAVYSVEAGSALPQDAAGAHCGARWLENELLRVEVGAGGLLRLTDKATGRALTGLHCFEDTGDAGDLYDYCPVSEQDPGAEPAEIACTSGPAQGGLIAELRLDQILGVPEALAPSGRSRSEERVALPVSSRLRLRAGCPWLEVETEVDNRARDHRLRVLFPTDLQTCVVWADGQSAITSRPAMPSGGAGWVQPPSGIAPHHTCFGAGDGRAGLAILSEGLPEHEGVEGEEGLTLALTLLRAVGELSRGDLVTRPGQAGPVRPTPDAQCLGVHRFRYGLLPYAGDPVDAGVAALAARFDAPLLAVPARTGCGELPAALSLVQIDGDGLELAALKRSEEGNHLVVRFVSLSAQGTLGRVTFGFPVSRVIRATAAEVETGELALLPGRQVLLHVQPVEIVTLLVEPVRARAS